MKKLMLFIVLAVASSVFAEPSVKAHQFTSAVVDRVPADDLTDAMNVNPLFFFTELIGFEGTSVTHRWTFNGNIMAEVAFNVGGPRWRVYSSKRFQPEWDGQWTVEVVNEAGEVITTDEIAIQID